MNIGIAYRFQITSVADSKKGRKDMLTQTKIQIDKSDYEFIKRIHKELNYRSLSQYMREAIQAKIKIDRKRLRDMKREAAMEMIGKASYDNLFESLEGEDFENR